MRLVAWERASGIALVESDSALFLLRPPFRELEPLTEVLVERLSEAFRLESDGTEYDGLSSLISGLRAQLTFNADLDNRPLDLKSVLLRTIPQMSEQTFASTLAAIKASLDPSIIFPFLEAVHTTASIENPAPWMSRLGIPDHLRVPLGSLTRNLPTLMGDWFIDPRDEVEHRPDAGGWRPPGVMMPTWEEV